MPLAEHLRELRRRLVRSLVAIAIGTVIGWVYYAQLFDFIREPFDDLSEKVTAQGLDVSLTLTGIADPFLLQLKVAAFAGVLLSSPVWIYQAWAFVSPGLHGHERRWGIGITATAVPLFLLGVVMAYYVVPQGLTILVGFTPEGVSNLIAVDRYLSFLLRLSLVFGVAFLLPVFVVGLNAAGIITSRQLGSAWRVVVFGIFLFAAIATPTPDPVTMLVLAMPMLALFGISLLITRLIDRRRGRQDDPLAGLSDDEASPLDL